VDRDNVSFFYFLSELEDRQKWQRQYFIVKVQKMCNNEIIENTQTLCDFVASKEIFALVKRLIFYDN
jgi:hypothetical protein